MVVTQYQDTRHVEEALERLVEANLAMGLVSEAQTAAAVLGHNFPDSRWYKDAYNLLQKKGGLEPPRMAARSASVPEEVRPEAPAAQDAMLVALAIRDIVLIDRLTIDFASGLTVLTGETGAGKSILLDALVAGPRRPRRQRAGPPRRGAGRRHGGLRRRRRPSGAAPARGTAASTPTAT